MPADDARVIVDGPVTPVIRLQRLGYRAAFAVLKVWWFTRRPQTRGVKLLIRDGGDVLFLRHSYGDRRAWEIPGGGRRAGETPAQTARREVGEELGLDIAEWTEHGTMVARKYATAHLACLSARYAGEPVRLALHEIEEARWAPADDPPQPLGEHARAALDIAAGRAGGVP